ncbi:MAG: restriction endonuclease [Phycisphaeraceae bacterium]|nr:restriction endonuclease [Phycisphaeraceae bacterium]
MDQENLPESAEPKWKQFERLVTAIHKAEAKGGKVTWNDSIDGRQFDATIRFEHALYSYLTVIECKDTARAVPVDDVEAFVTKSRGAGANKAVMVSSSGYQEGCYKVARENRIGLYTLTELDEAPEGYLTDDLTPAVQVLDVELQAANGAWVRLRDEGGSLSYYVMHTRVLIGRTDRPLWDWIDGTVRQSLRRLRGTPAEFSAKFPPATRVRLPHNDGEFNSSEVRFKSAIVEARVMRDPMDPSLVPKVYSWRDELEGTERKLAPHPMALGHETVMTGGKFYVNPMPFYYYCRAVTNGMARLVLLESYQHGTLIRAELDQEAKYAHFYVEVKDRPTLKRLRYLLADYDRLDAEHEAKKRRKAQGPESPSL